MTKKLTRFFFGLLVLTMGFFVAAQSPAQPEPNKFDQKVEGVAKGLSEKAKDNSWLATTAAIIGLIGTGVPALAKTLEVISLRSRRKQDLERIQDLTDLMKKIKEEEVLSQSTLAAVCEQIDAEIQAALAGLARTRQHHEMVLSKKKERQDPQLSFTRSALLLFRPHGFRAWLAHLLAYWWAFCAVVFCLPIADPETRSVFIGLVLFSFLLFLLSRTWALRQRSQWRKQHPAVIGKPLTSQQQVVNP